MIFMDKKDEASISIMKIIGISLIIILIFGVTVMATEIDIRSVQITMANGYTMTVVTTKTSVEEILEDNNIVVEDDERVTPSLDDEITDSNKIVITNKSEQEVQIAKLSESGVETSLDEILKSYSPIIEKIVVEQETIPYETITKDVSNNDSSKREVVIQRGKDGLREVTYKIKYQNDVEIERTEIASNIIEEPVDKIVEVRKNVVTNRSSRSYSATYSNGVWSYSDEEFDLLCAITAQECSSSYEGALAVITCACNRAESAKWARNGQDPLSQYKAKNQFCYSIDNYWRRRLNGNYADCVKQAVSDALNGKRNHNYLSFRSAGYASGEYIGGNVYF